MKQGKPMRTEIFACKKGNWNVVEKLNSTCLGKWIIEKSACISDKIRCWLFPEQTRF